LRKPKNNNNLENTESSTEAEYEGDPLTASVEDFEKALDAPSPPARKRRAVKRVAVPQQEEIKAAKKSSTYELLQRRQNVQRLRLRGFSLSQIAKQLGISILTAKKDLDEIQKINQEKVNQFQQSQFVGETLVVFDEIIQHAWNEFEHAEPGSKIRLQSLDLIRSTQNDKMKSLQDTGMIHKAPQQVEHKHSLALPWDDQMKSAVIDQLLQSQLTPQLALPTPDFAHESGKNIIDAEIISDNSSVPSTRKE